MPEEKVGIVIKYFAKIGVAAISLTEGSLKKGDLIHITGHTTDLNCKVESLQVEHESVEEARKGSDVGIKVPDRVREHDDVYRVTGEGEAP